MELSLIEKPGQGRKTRLKISTKEWNSSPKLRARLSGKEPVKESSRYKYFIIDEDLLNAK